MRTLILASLTLMVLPSCSLFTDDATPALEASQTREGIFLRQSKAFETVVMKASGITAAQKTAMLNGIAKDRADYGTLAEATHEWLEELGDINWITIAKNGYRLYKEGKQ